MNFDKFPEIIPPPVIPKQLNKKGKNVEDEDAQNKRYLHVRKILELENAKRDLEELLAYFLRELETGNEAALEVIWYLGIEVSDRLKAVAVANPSFVQKLSKNEVLWPSLITVLPGCCKSMKEYTEILKLGKNSYLNLSKKARWNPDNDCTKEARKVYLIIMTIQKKIQLQNWINLEIFKEVIPNVRSLPSFSPANALMYWSEVGKKFSYYKAHILKRCPSFVARSNMQTEIQKSLAVK